MTANRRSPVRCVANSRSSARSLSAKGRARCASSRMNSTTCCGEFAILLASDSSPIVGKAKQLRFFTAQLDDLVHQFRVVPFGFAKLAGARAVGTVHLLAQSAVVGILHYRHVGRGFQREQPARLAGCTCRLLQPPAARHPASRQVRSCPRQPACKSLVASSRLSEKRDDNSDSVPVSPGKRAFCSSGNSAPPRRKSRNSFSMIFLRAALSPANSALLRRALNFSEQREILSQLGVILGDLRQRRVINLAQFGAVHHRVQMPDRPPGARQAFVGIFHRHDEILPGGLRIVCQQATINARFSASNWSIAGATCSGLISAKRGRPVKSSSGFISSRIK